MRKVVVILLFMLVSFSKAQTTTLTPIVWQVSVSLINEQCNKGAAGIQIANTTNSLVITWSNGQSNVTSIADLTAGDYSVKLKEGTQDTTITFKIAKEECPVIISNHFTPNDDNYNDTWQISNTANYPNMEVIVFNKWGQQVHEQKNTYKPWDGTNLGINVPDGAYYYVFYYDKGNKNKHLKGSITILR
jgi:gliding motility-associated-like protein